MLTTPLFLTIVQHPCRLLQLLLIIIATHRHLLLVLVLLLLRFRHRPHPRRPTAPLPHLLLFDTTL